MGYNIFYSVHILNEHSVHPHLYFIINRYFCYSFKGKMKMSNEKQGEKKRLRYRLDVLIIISVFILLITFCAYMINTDLEDTLKAERGQEIVTHDYTFEDSSQTEE